VAPHRVRLGLGRIYGANDGLADMFGIVGGATYVLGLVLKVSRG